MKTFMVADQAGNLCIEAEQLATFTADVGGTRFRFVVTRIPGGPRILTHRKSGKGMADITAAVQVGHDYVTAGRTALDMLIRTHGEARVLAALRRAELPKSDER